MCTRLWKAAPDTLNAAFTAGQVGGKLAVSEHCHFMKNGEKYFGSWVQTQFLTKCIYIGER